MKLSITYNREKNGIELRFDPKLSDDTLKGYLLAIGFRKSNAKGGIWYVVHRPSYDVYAKDLQEAFDNKVDPNTIRVKPSYDAATDLIDHARFSLVTIKTEEDREKGIHYVVFEDIKKTATDIATRFAEQTYGDALVSVHVSPRNYKNKARNAFDEGRIITAAEDNIGDAKTTKETAPKASTKPKPAWLKTQQEYIQDKGATAEALNDADYLDKITHEHEQLLLQKLISGVRIPETILQAYPKLGSLDNFKYSYEGIHFGSAEVFLTILNEIGNTGNYYTGQYSSLVTNKRLGTVYLYVWKGDDLQLVTSKNPLLDLGYAAKMVVEGNRKAALPIIKKINEVVEFEGDLHHHTIDLEEVQLSEQSYSYTSFTNEKGVYTRAHAGARYRYYHIPFPKKLKFEAAIELVRDEQDQYVYGLDVTNYLSGWSGYSFAPHKGDDTYATKKEALLAALNQILGSVQYEHTEAVVQGGSKTLIKGYHQAIDGIYRFAKRKKIKLPEEQSKAILPLSHEEEVPKNAVAHRSSTLHTWDEYVEKIVEELQELETQLKDKGIAFTITHVISDLQESIRKQKGEALTYRLTRIYSVLLDIGYSLPQEPYRDQYFGIIRQLGKKVNVKPFVAGQNYDFTIIQRYTTLDDTLETEFQSLIALHPNALHIIYQKPEKEEALSIVKVSISSDRDTISFLHRNQDNSLCINVLNPHNEGIVSYSGSAIPMGKLKKAITYILANPQRLRIALAQVYSPGGTNSAIAVDIQYGKHYVPNVLLPEGIDPEYNFGTILKHSRNEVEATFPWLFAMHPNYLIYEIPSRLFIRSQFSAWEDLSLELSISTLRSHWSAHGADLFELLGYPTDPKYPYVNIHNGFKRVLPLHELTESEEDEMRWWNVVENARPVANMQRALHYLEDQIKITKKAQQEFTDPKTGNAKTQKEAQERFRDIQFDIDDFKQSQLVIEQYIGTIQPDPEDTKGTPTKESEDDKPEVAPVSEESDFKEEAQQTINDENLENQEAIISPEVPIQSELEEGEEVVSAIYRQIPKQEADGIRKQLETKGFKIRFTGKEVFDRNLSIVAMNGRAGYHSLKLEDALEKEYDKWISILEKDIEKLAGKRDSKSNQSRAHRQQRIAVLRQERSALVQLFEQEETVFYDELFLGFVERAKAQGYTINRGGIAAFRLHMMTSLFEGRMLAHYPDMLISKATYLLIDDYFGKHQHTPETTSVSNTDYLDRVIAIMHDHYMEGRRLSRKKITAIKQEAGVPNLGMLWEAVELSWLLWYKNLYHQPGSFGTRLQTLIQFWDTVQPTYAYSDSSKEQYKQYSTPCPIGAMIAGYTNMACAAHIFEPSAGNGLLVVGADPSKTHVNEIDNSRRKSLEFQGFATITHYNAAEPFPDALTHTFDVVVTNPPFDRWSADAFDKDRMVKKYFDSNIGLSRHLRLEHLMSGLALHTMKDSGKAALIIKGHIKFREDDGYMATYKPFFNWLYSRYVVDDVINMNGYTLYNKQGAVTEMMLVLIGGRKPRKSKKVAPNREQAGYLADIIESFEALWQRIASHIKTPLQQEIDKLKLALGYDIF